MDQTSPSLLDRLRIAPDAATWDRLVRLYEPFIRRNVAYAVSAADVDDLVQEVLAVVVRGAPNFDRRRAGSFRTWLRTVTVHKIAEFHRRGRVRAAAAGGTDAAQRLADLADPASALSRQWDADHDAHVVKRLLELLEPEFMPSTWLAFRMQVLDGQSSAEAAAAAGISIGAAQTAKSRVLARMREEAAGLVG